MDPKKERLALERRLEELKRVEKAHAEHVLKEFGLITNDVEKYVFFVEDGIVSYSSKTEEFFEVAPYETAPKYDDASEFNAAINEGEASEYNQVPAAIETVEATAVPKYDKSSNSEPVKGSNVASGII